ncbi:MULTISPECIES: GNAT family N-acetyltransferase [unclassified Paenibacillus]|uniref:GNAT family N-acetyltransferase n=1 Tax=unclassified Paenibacillus TaxID=185978 RepID=UPI00362DE55E
MVIRTSNYYVAIACERNKVIGTSIGLICYDLVGDCIPFMLIENVIVLSSVQGQGVGRLLIQSLEVFGQRVLFL